MSKQDAVSPSLAATKGQRDLSAFAGLTNDEKSVIQKMGAGEYAVWRHLTNNLGQLVCRVSASWARAPQSQPVLPAAGGLGRPSRSAAIAASAMHTAMTSIRSGSTNSS